VAASVTILFLDLLAIWQREDQRPAGKQNIKKHKQKTTTEIWVCDQKSVAPWKGDIQSYKTHLKKEVIQKFKK